MRIILSPAKKMNENTDDLAPKGLPVYMEQTEQIKQFMQNLSYDETKNSGSAMTRQKSIQIRKPLYFSADKIEMAEEL